MDNRLFPVEFQSLVRIKIYGPNRWIGARFVTQSEGAVGGHFDDAVQGFPFVRSGIETFHFHRCGIVFAIDLVAEGYGIEGSAEPCKPKSLSVGGKHKRLSLPIGPGAGRLGARFITTAHNIGYK